MSEAYEVIVTRDGRMREQSAIASAAGYVCATAAGDVFDVNVYGGGSEDYGIGICVAFEENVPGFDDMEHVESADRISYSLIE
jgi:hypothetical protein